MLLNVLFILCIYQKSPVDDTLDKLISNVVPVVGVEIGERGLHFIA